MSYQTIMTDPTRNIEPGSELTLLVVAGPHAGPFTIPPDKMGVIGRQSQCDIQLADPSVSRVHAGVEFKRGRWFVTDRLSRGGTLLNSLKLEPHAPAPLGDGDVLEIGPWRLQVQLGAATPSRIQSARQQHRLADSTSGQIELVKSEELLRRTQRQLGLVMDFATAIQEAKDEVALAEIVVRAASQGSGYSRSAVVKLTPAGDRAEIIAAVAEGQPCPKGFPISRSLVRSAAGGQMTRLTADPILREAQSIVSFGIRSAICAPIMIGGTPAAYLYVDNGDREAASADEAAAFLAAVARLGGLALGDFSRRSLQERQRQLDADLTAARLAQERLMPPPTGRIGPIEYATCSRPGRLVAGDLFEVAKLPDGRVAMFLGDVAGKGVGAAVLMAAAQTQLRAALIHEKSLAFAISELNREVVARAPTGEFISLFAGIFDAKTSTLEFVDAGHGYWLHRPVGGSPTRLQDTGSLVLGVEPDFPYESQKISIKPGDRLVMFSDGVVEQHAPSGVMFGFENVFATLEKASSESEDVESLLDALLSFAQTDALADDVTIASARFWPVEYDAVTKV